MSRPSPTREILLLVTCIAAYWAIRSILTTLPHVEMSWAQAIVFPFFAYAIYRLALLVSPIPRMMLCIPCAIGFLGLIVAWNYHSLGRASIVVAKLDGDPLGTTSRILRKAIDGEARGRHPLGVRPFLGVISTTEEARLMLEDEPSIRGVVWGDDKRIRVTLASSVQAEPLVVAGVADPFKIVTGVPEVLLSFEPMRESSRFIASLFAADEPGLIDAGRQFAGWSAYHHRALPWWELGNRYLKRSLEGGKYSYGAMDCALDAYQQAIDFAPSDRESTLSASVRINQAVAGAILSRFEGRRGGLERATSSLRRTIRRVPQGTDRDVLSVVTKHNMSVLHALRHEKAKGKRER